VRPPDLAVTPQDGVDHDLLSVMLIDRNRYELPRLQ